MQERLTQNTVEIPAVQEQVIVQEIPQVSIVERIQEQSAITGLMNPQFSNSAVEAPQVVKAFPLLEDVAAREYNQVHQEQIVATVQPLAIFRKFQRFR